MKRHHHAGVAALYRRMADTRVVVGALAIGLILAGIMMQTVDGSMVNAFQTSFTREAAEDVLRRWGAENVARFRDIMWLDFIFPAAHAVFFASLIARTTIRAGEHPTGLHLLLFATPLAAGAFDYVENVLVIYLLAHPDSMPASVIFAASVASSVKIALTILSVFAALAFLAVRVVGR